MNGKRKFTKWNVRIVKTAEDAAGRWEELRGAKEVKNQTIYKRALKLAIPMMIQNGITNMVSMLPSIMDREMKRDSVMRSA